MSSSVTRGPGSANGVQLAAIVNSCPVLKGGPAAGVRNLLVQIRRNGHHCALVLDVVPRVALWGSLEPRRLVGEDLVSAPRSGELDLHRLLAVRQRHRVRPEVGMAGALEPQTLL